MFTGMLSCSRRIGTSPQERPMLRGVSRVEEGSVTAVLTAPESMSDLDVGEAPGRPIFRLVVCM